MAFGLIPFTSDILIQKHAVNEIMGCNDYTKKFGLIISQNQAIELVKTRSIALNHNGRIEFGGGIIDIIIKEFCDSVYISMENYTQIINGLIEAFYYYKNETLDLISDEDLIKFMKFSFDGVCQGSVELLIGHQLYEFARKLRYGYSFDHFLIDMTYDEECEDE